MEEKSTVFTVRNVLRILALICIIFVFCPTFLVSCSGQDLEVSVMTAVGGVTAYGETVAEPQPIMLSCLILPIVAVVILFLRKLSDKKAAVTGLVCAVLDTIIWFVFRAAVKSLAEENYCTFKTTAWFVLNIIVLLLIILLNVLVLFGKAHLDSQLVSIFSGADTQGALSQMSDKMGQMSGAVSQFASNVAAGMGGNKKNAIGFCQKCGAPIEYGNKFCTSCGTLVPESLIAEAEEARRIAEEKARQEEEARQRAAEEKARQEEEARQRAAEEKTRQEEEARQRAEAERDIPRASQEATDGNSSEPQDDDTPAFCFNCGAKLSPGTAFCESCGTKIK